MVHTRLKAEQNVSSRRFKNDTPYLQVSDRRGVGADGQAQGWNVTVSVSDFVNGSQVLQGAELDFGTSTVKSTSDNESTGPTSQTVTGLSKASAATPIFTAAKIKVWEHGFLFMIQQISH